MSKKSKKNTNKEETMDNTVGAAVLAQMGFVDTTDDGFIKLNPTDIGERKMEDIRTRRSKKASTAPEPTPKTRAYEDFDAQKAAAMLDSVTEKVKAGKFKKALALRDKELIENLIGAFVNMDKDLPNFPKVCEVITKLLRICKTFYEHADELEFIDDGTYDGIMARYRSLGLTEPQEYVPDDKSGKKSKVGVKYPTLHNTMDKAYAIRGGDKIPDGVKESDRIEDFIDRIYSKLGLKSSDEIELELSPKIDGVSVNGTIQNSKDDEAVLLSPQTRGDETESLQVIGMDGLSVGTSITDGTFGVQYEAFVTDEDLAKASEYLKLETPYKSNRHAAAGIINRLCNTEDDELLMFISLYPIESSGLDGTYTERMDLLQSYGIVPDDMIKRKIIKGNKKKLLEKIEKRFKKINGRRENLSYAVDGMVITVVDDKYQSALERNGRTNLYQIALKFDPATANAEVAGIHLDRGKKGYRTIQVDLKTPVYLDGVKYDHVPVLSAELFKDLGLRVGSVVNVHRVGDVIPAISVVRTGTGETIRLPVYCPDCGAAFSIRNKKLYCPNLACSGNLAGRILGFFEDIGMDGYGESFVKTILTNFPFVQTIGDLFDLTPEAFKMVNITTKLAREFLSTMINAIAHTPDYKILGSLGIPDLGPARAKQVLEEFGSWKAFVDSLDNQCSTPFAKAVGYRYANSMRDAIYHSTETRDNLKKDVAELSKYMRTFTTNFNKLVTIGHTGGALPQKVLDICNKHGYDVTDGKSFDILITADMESKSGKMKTAKKKDLPIYTVETFLDNYYNW